MRSEEFDPVDVAATIELLKFLWERDSPAPKSMFGRPTQRIFGSDWDGHHFHVLNPYWEIVRHIPAELDPFFHEGLLPGVSMDGMQMRFQLCQQFSWSILSPNDVTWMKSILKGQSIVEIGAGSGYWAWILEQSGMDVAAYDIAEAGVDNHYCRTAPYTTVLRDGVQAAGHHPDRALLLVWPPYDEPVAAQALQHYSGELLLYAGEDEGGATADDQFFMALDRDWVPLGESPRHITWWGIHDCLKAYRRKRTR